jgi:hypothetical protein
MVEAFIGDHNLRLNFFWMISWVLAIIYKKNYEEVFMNNPCIFFKTYYYSIRVIIKWTTLEFLLMSIKGHEMVKEGKFRELC